MRRNAERDRNLAKRKRVNRTRSKKRSPKLSARRRSEAARKGWITRRRRAAQEHKRRSVAAKKEWRRRKARIKILRAAQKPLGPKKGRLAEFIVTWSYKGAASRANKGSKSRSVGFTVIARSAEDAELYVVKAVASGADTNGADLTWMEQVPWDETFTTKPEEEEGEEALDRRALRAAGEGYVELR